MHAAVRGSTAVVNTLITAVDDPVAYVNAENNVSCPLYFKLQVLGQLDTNTVCFVFRRGARCCPRPLELDNSRWCALQWGGARTPAASAA